MMMMMMWTLRNLNDDLDNGDVDDNVDDDDSDDDDHVHNDNNICQRW